MCCPAHLSFTLRLQRAHRLQSDSQESDHERLGGPRVEDRLAGARHGHVRVRAAWAQQVVAKRIKVTNKTENMQPCTSEERASAHNIHNDVAQRKKQRRREWLGKEIRQNVSAAHEGDGDIERLHFFAHEKVATVYVLRALMVLRVVGQ
eukprot:5927494-Pleurochrysis_carterae.AAC.1